MHNTTAVRFCGSVHGVKNPWRRRSCECFARGIPRRRSSCECFARGIPWRRRSCVCFARGIPMFCTRHSMATKELRLFCARCSMATKELRMFCIRPYQNIFGRMFAADRRLSLKRKTVDKNEQMHCSVDYI